MVVVVASINSSSRPIRLLCMLQWLARLMMQHSRRPAHYDKALIWQAVFRHQQTGLWHCFI